MANIVFIAVQCCQCSTMQVKQQKKSSNRWTCVVCNEKQSVRKVFARGFMAKDIRKFVQSFNMSRSFTDQLTADCEASSPEIDGRSVGIGEEGDEEEKKKKRRVDWNEYLDEDDLHRDEEFGAGVEGTGSELEPKIVTEWPDEFITKPKLKSHDFSQGRCEASYKPVFSKRNKDFVCQGKDMRSQFIKSNERLTGEGIIRESDNLLGNPKQSQKAQLAKSTPVAKFGASKWEQYIEKDHDNQCLRERNRGSKAADDLDCRYDEYDLEVEEDVHPDFL